MGELLHKTGPAGRPVRPGVSEKPDVLRRPNPYAARQGDRQQSHDYNLGEIVMSLSLILLIVLILILVGALPSWGYSKSWGYGPSGGIGLVVLILVILLLMGRI